MLALELYHWEVLIWAEILVYSDGNTNTCTTLA